MICPWQSVFLQSIAMKTYLSEIIFLAREVSILRANLCTIPYLQMCHPLWFYDSLSLSPSHHLLSFSPSYMLILQLSQKELVTALSGFVGKQNIFNTYNLQWWETKETSRLGVVMNRNLGWLRLVLCGVYCVCLHACVFHGDGTYELSLKEITLSERKCLRTYL